MTHQRDPLLPPEASTPSSFAAMLSTMVDWFWSMLCRNLPSGSPNLQPRPLQARSQAPSARETLCSWLLS